MSNVATIERTPLAAVGMTREGSGSRIAPQNLGEVIKFAEVMSRAGKMLPAHLQGDVGACMAVSMQALDWQMNPFAVASKSYFVGGRVAYEAQLIAAVVNTRSGIKGRLRYDYDGDGATLTCTVTGTLDGTECTYTTPPMGSITVKNSPLWKSDPRQQLGYFAARSWARRHCPEVILGVYDRDEAAEMKDVTPPQGTGLAARLQGGSGGFSARGVAATLDGSIADASPEAADGAAVVEDAPADEPEPIIGADAQHDPEYQRAGAQACVDGDERRVPDGISPADAVAWLDGYDSVARGQK